MISKEDAILISKFDEIRQKGYYVDSKQLADVYNRVLNKNVAPTNCSACCRGRVQELVDALKRQEREEQKKSQEALNNNNPNNSTSEENKALTDETGKQPVEKKTRVGKKK